MAKRIPTLEEVHRLFTYDEDRGLLIWNIRPVSDFMSGWLSADAYAKIWNGRFAGTIAGIVCKSGYRHIKIGGVFYFAHRLIWLHVKGFWPPDQIDHELGTSNGDHVENLRLASYAENAKNCAISIKNKSGVTGVIRRGNKWKAYIVSDKRQIFLGNFVEKQDAIAARKDAERKYGFHPNHGRRVA